MTYRQPIIKERRRRRKRGYKDVSFATRKAKASGNIMLFTFILGTFGGILLYHTFKSSVDKIWTQVPYINKIKAGYGYEYEDTSPQLL